MKDQPKGPRPVAQSTEVIEVDNRTSKERVEDLVFETRIKELTAKKRGEELRLVMMVYASILTDREES